jgi:hypothetical protein
MSRIDDFEAFFRRAMDNKWLSAEDDKRLYELAVNTGIIPAFLVRLLYLLWLESHKESL